MALEHVTDHVDQAQGRLASQYRDTNVEGLVLAPVPGQQAVEDALWETLQVPVIDSAEGEQLDLLGRIVGEPRYSRDDATYRLWLKARVAINKSNGTVAELLYIVGLVKPAEGTLVFEPQFPASFVLRIEDAATAAADAPQIASVIREARSAGVRSILEWIETAEAAAFCFDGGAGLGFGDSTNAATGGALAGAAE